MKTVIEKEMQLVVRRLNKVFKEKVRLHWWRKNGRICGNPWTKEIFMTEDHRPAALDVLDTLAHEYSHCITPMESEIQLLAMWQRRIWHGEQFYLTLLKVLKETHGHVSFYDWSKEYEGLKKRVYKDKLAPWYNNLHNCNGKEKING